MITILLIWTNVRGSSRDWQMPQIWPRFQYSQTANPCLQPRRRQNSEKMSEYPHEEVIPHVFPQPTPSQCAVELCWLRTRPASSLWEESAADSEMIEESHRFCHCDPRGDLAGRASALLKCSSWAKPLERAVGSSALHGRTSASRGQYDFRATTPEMQCLVHMFTPSYSFPLTPPLLQLLRCSQSDSRMDGVTGHPRETQKEHNKQNCNLKESL